MVKTIEQTKIRDANQLADEIEAAFPELKGVMMMRGNDVKDRPEKFVIRLPDSADEVAIQAIIDAHVPKPRVRRQVTTAQLLQLLADERGVELI